MAIAGYREGFYGEKVYRLTQDQINQSENNSLSNDLYVTDIGYFPNAVNHLVERDKPSTEAILIYCLRGDGWFELDGVKEPVRAGEFILIPANQPHRYGSNGGWQIYWVHFGGARATEIVSRVGECSQGALPGPEPEEVVQLFEKMIGRAEEGLTTTGVSYLHFALWHLLGLFVVRGESAGSLAGVKARVSAVIEFMKKRLGDRLTLDQMSEHAGYSASHFTQLFKGHTGYAPIDFYLQLKVQYASKLLTTGQMKVSDIALECGYENPYYFSRMFRKITGYSPRQYRQKYRV